MKDGEQTRVIFRVWKDGYYGGDVIALFPDDPADCSGLYCGSYMHIGQHSAADLGLIDSTRPAKPEEYDTLRKELESEPYGYNLRVIRRVNRSDAYRNRRAVIRQIEESRG